MNFDFFVPTKLITGKNCLENNATLLSELGNRCIIVSSGTAAKKSGALEDVIGVLSSKNIEYIIHDSVAQNPLVSDAYEAGIKANKFGADFVIGIGGGSALDAAKAVAVYASNLYLELLELFDNNWKNPALPIVAIGTTAGTGSEVNGFSVLTKPDGRKQSISNLECYPKLTFGDYSYTNSVPLDFTNSTALDALSHCIEGYYSTKANEFSDMFAIRAIRTLYPALEELSNINNIEEISEKLREKLYFASVMAGYCLAICGTTYCHALSYFLTEEHHLAHGYACAVFLPGQLSRAKRLMPTRSEELESLTFMCIEELEKLIVKLTQSIKISLTTDEIKAQVDKKASTMNFKTTAPDGLSADEAYQLVQTRFS